MNQQSSSYYRTVARNALKGHWGKAVGVTALGYALPYSVTLAMQFWLSSIIERATQAGVSYIQEHIASIIGVIVAYSVWFIFLAIVLGAT